MSRFPAHLEAYVLEFIGLPQVFFASCKSGCTQLVRELLYHDKMNHYLDRCRLHLHQSFVVACLYGSVDAARLLLLRFDISSVCQEYAIREAAALDQVSVVRLILSLSNFGNANLLAKALHSACFTGSKAVVNFIVRKNVLVLDSMPQSLLPLACLTGCNELVRRLLSSSRSQQYLSSANSVCKEEYLNDINTFIDNPGIRQSSLKQAFQIARQGGNVELSALIFAAINDAKWMSEIRNNKSSLQRK